MCNMNIKTRHASVGCLFFCLKVHKKGPVQWDKSTSMYIETSELTHKFPGGKYNCQFYLFI